MLPNRVRLSTKATQKLQYIKQQTGITPNILSRVAIMLAVNEEKSLKNASVADYEGQALEKSVLFGEHTDVYDVIINQYIHDNKVELDTQKAIASLVEIGVHKMGHIKNLSDLCALE